MTTSLPLSCDDAYLYLLTTLHETPISDHHYAVELQLQEAIMSSLTTPIPTKKHPGESSQTLCEICADYKDEDELFPIPNCTHKFCEDCLSRHISVIIKQKNVLQVLSCPGPGCNGVLEMDRCRSILSKDVVTMLDDAVCEAMIEPRQRFYCPYKDCSALLVNDEEGMKEAECPVCRRLVCVRCNAPWHAGMKCDEYLCLGEGERGRDGLMVHDMAKTNLWRRCSRCRFYVEKTDGCLHITCRCGYQFCYRCGKDWVGHHNCDVLL